MSKTSSPDIDGTLTSARLFQKITALAQLASNLARPIRLSFLVAPDLLSMARPTETGATEGIIHAAFHKAGIEGLRFEQGREATFSSFELFLSMEISKALDYRFDHFDSPDRLAAALQVLSHHDFSDTSPEIERVSIPASRSLSLSAYASSQRDQPAVLLVLPCGMPFNLCRDWFLFLATRYFVVTWESRGLFGKCDDFDDIGTDAASQVEDLMAVMDYFELSDAHVMGVCGGAALALCATPRLAGRLNSLSLWYGDYNVSNPALRTDHQRNFDWLTNTAAQSREQARDLHSLFADPSILATVPLNIAHVALFPYANVELLYRYSRLNDGLNQTALNTYFDGVGVPTLVAAGDHDKTTHTGGSRLVADSIAGALLHIERGGTHEDFFGLPEGLKTLASEFIESNVEESVR